MLADNITEYIDSTSDEMKKTNVNRTESSRFHQAEPGLSNGGEIISAVTMPVRERTVKKKQKA